MTINLTKRMDYSNRTTYNIMKKIYVIVYSGRMIYILCFFCSYMNVAAVVGGGGGGDWR